MKGMIHFFKLRWTAKPFDIHKECVSDVKTGYWLCYDGNLYYGHRFGILVYSNCNIWWKNNPNNPKKYKQ